MTLNELIGFAKTHDIDFDKDIMCVTSSDDDLMLDNIEQVAMKESDEGNKLVVIPFVHSYDADMNKGFELWDTVNSWR